MRDLKKDLDPRDHGWAWVVLLAGVFANLIMWGSCYNVGILNVLFLDALNDSRGKTAWIGAVNTCLVSSLGPVSSIFVNKIGFRWTIILGGFLTSLGSALSFFATNVTHLILSLGVLGGVGLGLCYTPVISVVTLYFDKYQIMATALSSAGSGIGTIVFAPMLQMLADKFDWRGTMLILGGIQLHLCLCGALIRPLPEVVMRSMTSLAEEQNIEINKKEVPLFQFEVLKNPKIIIFMCNILFINLGGFIVYLHLSAYAIEMGTSPLDATVLMSVIGIASLVSRLMIPATAIDPNIGVLLIYAGSLGVTGVVVLATPMLMSTYIGQMLVAFMFGFYGSGYVPLMTPLAVDFAGLKLLTAACGVVNLTSGIGTLVGPPLAGFIYDATLDYEYGFFLAGLMLIFSSLIMFVAPLISKEAHDNLHNQDRVSVYDTTIVADDQMVTGNKHGGFLQSSTSIYSTYSKMEKLCVSSNNLYASTLIINYLGSRRSLHVSKMSLRPMRTRTISNNSEPVTPEVSIALKVG